ncbi:MAG TPA: hypothetical protein VF613_10480 [Longimicrobium sp.]|jgi:hypothetical protein
MMILDVQQAQLDYVATFAEPAFALWTDVPGMMGGLYGAFAGLHTGLTDFAVEGDERDPLAQKVVATLGNQGFFRVGYDRVEAVLPDYTGADLTEYSSTLKRGDGWLRGQWPAPVIHAHYLTFSIHAELRDGSPIDYLRGLSNRELPGIGDSLGTGLIFHVAIPNTLMQVHLTVDHSTVLDGGLFVQHVVTVGSDQIVHADVLHWSTQTLDQALWGLGLMFPGVG